MCLGKEATVDLQSLCGEDIKASELGTVLGVEVENKLSYKIHIETLCSKASHYKESQIF